MCEEKKFFRYKGLKDDTEEGWTARAANKYTVIALMPRTDAL